jgi:hypothetical protein
MAAKLALIMLILTVKSKSLVPENKFSNVSHIFLHNLYHKISFLFLKSLITQKNQTFSRGF